MDAESARIAALAQFVGAHALPLFAAALFALLVGTGAVWWTGVRHVVPRLQTRLTPGALLLALAVAGFAVVLLAALVFAELAEALRPEEEIGLFDQALAEAIARNVPLAVVQFFAAFTRFGDPIVLTGLAVGVAGILIARGRRELALAWVLALAGNALLTPSLKAVFHRVRPVHDDGLVLASGFSFPSGHASGATVAYGMLAYVLVRLLPAPWHLPVVLLATAVVFTTGCSRVFLRVHFASDVVAGFATGVAWLAVCCLSVELVRRRRAAA